ncbi:MAG: HNH endonuclease [Hyphomicrobiales bacterium]|nr:HNH endonuclease [Hyphomicrobiales bacterium]MCC2106718.1 HNH endonuclease [Hyphomicrobiales bacterium]
MPLVFDTKPDSGYDDHPSERYHFPNRYLAIAASGIGDWIVYRKPRRGAGDPGYFAAARLVAIDADPAAPNSSYARLEHYLPFDAIVPQAAPSGRPFEAALRAVPAQSRGAAIQGKSIRPLSPEDFAAIALAGLHATFDPRNAIRLELDRAHCDPETFDLVNAPVEAQERQIKQILLNRKIRDAAFRGAVCIAYDSTCAVTGLRIINGGGKSEVQAAHIWPVAEGGPDIVQNGIALSGTIHWLFDRKLISVSDDYRLLVSHNKVPRDLQQLFQNQLNRIRLPAKQADWPHPAYLRRHRESAMIG